MKFLQSCPELLHLSLSPLTEKKEFRNHRSRKICVLSSVDEEECQRMSVSLLVGPEEEVDVINGDHDHNMNENIYLMKPRPPPRPLNFCTRTQTGSLESASKNTESFLISCPSANNMTFSCRHQFFFFFLNLLNLL